MAYTAHNFQSGDILTANHMNEIEAGIVNVTKTVDEEFFPAMSDAAILESQKNPFAWEPFDKGYITFIFDDLRDSIDSPCSIFEEYGFPIVLAAIPARENDIANGLSTNRGNYVPGMTMKNICLQVAADGGEIMAHNARAINSTLQYDREFMYDYFIGTKRKLEEWGLNVRGIIRAGGTDQLSFSSEIDRWLFANYEYSNMSEQFANHNLQRVTINQSFEDLKTAIDNAAANNGWVRVMAHDYDYGEGETFTGEEDLRDILDYCKTAGISVVTCSYMYDRFGSSSLANNRDTSLETMIPDTKVDNEYYDAVTGVNYTGTPTGGWSKYTVTPGKTYFVTGSAPYSGAVYPVCAFFDGVSDYRLAAYGADPDSQLSDYEVVAPANASFMVLNTTNIYSRPAVAKIEVDLSEKVQMISDTMTSTLEDVAQLRTDLDQLAIDRNTARTLIGHKAKVEGSLISCIDKTTTGTGRSGWEYRSYEVTPGAAYYVSGRSASNATVYPLCAFFSEGSNYRIAAYGGESDTAYSQLRVIAPNDAVEMIVNSSSTTIQPISARAELDLGEQVTNINAVLANLESRIAALES